MKKLTAGIIVFLGTNCDRDTKIALDTLGFKTEFIFHTEKAIKNYDLIVLPGGFSFGDYIRAGRLAKLSPAVFALQNLKNTGYNGFILGICNGFQILTESGLLPGALIENAGTKFISRDETLIFNNKEITLPIAHKEGCFWADPDTIRKIEENNMVFLRYKNNPNGSINDIAGLYDRKNKIMGLMPHPERAVLKECAPNGTTDGISIFNFIKEEILR